jgi:PAT family beta-lactamase induction signal transducer AmpG
VLVEAREPHPWMKKYHPSLWLPMGIPIGISTGFISVALANSLTGAGVSESAVGDVVGTYFLALACGALWGPAIDILSSRSTWVTVGVIVTAGALAVMVLIPPESARTPVLKLLAFVSGTGAIIVALASKGIAAHVLTMDKRALAGGWYAAGNLGTASLGGALGVWLLASKVSRLAIAGLLVLGVMLTLLAAVRLPVDIHEQALTIRRQLRVVFADTWAMLRGPKGMVALALCSLPFATGAAINLMPSAAQQWNTGVGIVSSASALSAPICALAALIGGWISVSLGSWRSYILLGIALFLLAFAAVVLPRTPTSYLTIYLSYAFIQGAIWSAFYAVVFDTAGQGAASTKMGVFLSLSNLPYWYCALIEGRALESWGIHGLLISDGLLGLVGCIFVVGLAHRVRLRIWRKAPVCAEAARCTTN